MHLSVAQLLSGDHMRLAVGCVKLRQRQGMWDITRVLRWCGMVVF